VKGGSGKAELSLSGYYEPKGDEMDDDMFYGQEGADEEEEDDDLDEDDDGELQVKKATNKKGEEAARLE